MLRTERELLLGLLVASLFLSSVTSDCGNCTIDKDCCLNHFNYTDCRAEFKPWINTSVDPIKESDKVILECYHNILPPLNLNYTWLKDLELKEDQKNKTFVIERVKNSDKGVYQCCVRTSCGDCGSPLFKVHFDTHFVVIIIICLATALALILILGVVMKIKLKKDQARHKERMRQKRLEREQDAQNGGPIPIPRSY